jgi:hypothetical protein
VAILGAGAVALILVGTVAVVALVLLRPGAGEPEARQAQAPASAAPAQGPGKDPGQPAPKPSAKGGPALEQKPAGQRPEGKKDADAVPWAGLPKEPAAGDGAEAVAQAQPPAGKVAVPDGSAFIAPSTASPWVVAFRGFPKESWNVVNLQTLECGDNNAGGFGLHNPLLSPDGKLLAGTKGFASTKIEVWSLAERKPLRSMQPDQKATGIAYIDFAPPGQLLILWGVGFELWGGLWDFDSGDKVRTFKIGSGGAYAMSPGRSYVAIADGKKIRIFDLAKGAEAGQLTWPGEGPGPVAAAFSPDGQKLACLFASFNQGRLRAWDLATGKLTAEHELNGDFGGKWPLQWLPDGSGWLVAGKHVVDHDTGSVLWTVPAAPKKTPAAQVRLVEPKHLALLRGNGVELVPLPLEEIAEAARKAKAGSGKAALPEARPGDWTGVKVIQPPAGAAPWRGAADPLPRADKLPVLNPLPLEAKGTQPAAVLFADPAAAALVVLSFAEPAPLASKVAARADRFDLVSGKHLGGLALGEVERGRVEPLVKRWPADFHPKGDLLLLAAPRDTRRLDVWSLAEPKHVVGWLPYPQDPGKGGEVTWAGFLDANRVLTLNGTGNLVLWQLPECKAVWSAQGFSAIARLSPGRKFLAAVRAGAVELLDPPTGERLGVLSPPDSKVETLRALAFQVEGKELAALYSRQGGPALARWDLTTGASGGTIRAPDLQAPQLHWQGTQYLVSGHSLFWGYPVIDWELGGALWHYSQGPPSLAANNAVDGRVWILVNGAKGTWQLRALNLPEDKARTAAADLVGAKAVNLLGPGATYQLQINGGSDLFRKAVEGRLDGHARAAGWSSGGGGLLFTLTVQESTTGKTRTYDEIGGKFKKTTIPVRQVVVTAVITHPLAGELQRRGATYETPDIRTITDLQGDLDTYLTRKLWDVVIGNSGHLTGLPPAAYQVNGKTVFLPGSSPLPAK